LAKYPSKYIYEPWEAPLAVQKAAGCVIGTDYPRRIVKHEEVLPRNLKRMNAAYAKDKKKRNADDDDDDEDGNKPAPKKKK